MARTINRMCDKCITNHLATAKMRFLFQGRAYELYLCDRQRRNMERDFLGWAGFAHELTAGDGETPRGVSGDVKIPVGVHKGPVINHDEPELASDGIDDEVIRSWFFTPHATQRMVERHITPNAAWRIIQSTKKTTRPGSEPDTTVYELGNVVLVVNEALRVVITVYDRSVDNHSLAYQKAR